jgi:acetyl esterase/lipase
MSYLKRWGLGFALITSILSATAQSGDSFELWPQGAPGALGDKDTDRPTLTPYVPSSETGPLAAIVICPGGGYGGLAKHEGHDYALWLNKAGIAAFVLKYRLGSKGYRHPAMLQDAARALRSVRANASNWKIDPKRIGVMGSSAGGHLASTLVTHFEAGNPAASDPIERVSSRPDLGILCYPVISMGATTHQGSKRNLLGKDPDPALVWLLSNELQVTPETPPCFLWHTLDDKSVLVENSLDFAKSLRRAGVPFDLHIYQKGRHGIGLANGHPWTKDCLFWLKEQKFTR